MDDLMQPPFLTTLTLLVCRHGSVADGELACHADEVGLTGFSGRCELIDKGCTSDGCTREKSSLQQALCLVRKHASLRLTTRGANFVAHYEEAQPPERGVSTHRNEPRQQPPKASADARSRNSGNASVCGGRDLGARFVPCSGRSIVLLIGVFTCDNIKDLASLPPPQAEPHGFPVVTGAREDRPVEG
ncbi:uncharacterized protein K460DRAFT_353668 [Cucurbitaria berberidis CBS 394.84]|uniref:Uncharacterized protein n=1 Tax=Cucurbitaria berberidis CBS 394.84 TaxID=1168544 RepID=A0A9P4GP19_9PLEO|nr:uncharacterized protein K460DRAFT_353668 [Cucurbitaria berberidis CBS 394.84]KAF1848724.1 hypothetical protein K460DRAFT_353668 [Cucurbitaria berberidis CBS 394.84]